MSMAVQAVQTIVAAHRPASQLRDVFRAQIQCALRDVGGAAGKIPANVHGARKQLKKARAVLRLLRPSVGVVIYRRENIAVRDAARHLSAVRDSEVLLATFDKAAARLTNDGESPNVQELRPALEDHVRRQSRQRILNAASVTEMRRALLSVRRRASRWTLQMDDWQHVLRGLGQTYGNGRSDLKRARDTPSTEHLHDWRKRAKYLWHQLQILTPIAPGAIGELADEFHRLSDYLGDEHDLAVLEDTVAKLDVRLVSRDRAALRRALEQRRTHLRGKAFALGRRLYAPRTREFVERVDALWNTWRNTTAGGRKKAEHTRAAESLP